MSDWREPVRPFFMPASGVPYMDATDDGDRQSLVMGFREGDPAIDIYLKGEVCNNCAYRMPAEPNPANLHLFEPISARRWSYPDEAVRTLIRNRQCPVCRAPVSAEINARMLVSDRWSADATRSDRLRAKQDAELEDLERREFQEKHA